MILKNTGKALVCIPNSEAANRKPVCWGPTMYSKDEYRKLYDPTCIYGSAFVTRPDSAPWIDTDDYWKMACQLWEDKNVTLVIGTRGGSLTHLTGALSVNLVYGPERDAYDEIDKLENLLVDVDQTILICLGACATVLAYRLAEHGRHALDLGHSGRYMPQRFLQCNP